MKYSLTVLLSILSLASPAWSQSAADKKPELDENSPAVKLWREFSNLSPEKRKEYGEKLTRVQNLFNQKRIFEALETIDELDKIFPEHPAALNVKGACYVEIRSFEKANAIFKKILELSPDNTSVLFNIAEVDFVTKKWAQAEKAFTSLLEKLPETQKGMIRLCEFKLLLCKLKLDKVGEAKAIAEKRDIWDDSPFYYYSRAAIHYHADDKIEAEKSLRSARFVWRNNAVLSPWQDTLIEFGYVKSFYGGDTEETKPLTSPEGS